MSRSIYLVNPAPDAPSYLDSEVFSAWGLKPAAFGADLTLPTLAAFVPEGWDVRLCDERLTPVDADPPEQIVGLTGKAAQSGRLRELADGFRSRGKTVVVGGPHASLTPEVVRPHCDVLVRGELEGLSRRLFGDLARGRPEAEYTGERTDPLHVPVPRWDLYPNERAMVGVVQTSRGCPFDCEFCDVGCYLGTGQRQRPLDDVMLDLEAVYAHGYRDVMLADDNLTADRPRARRLLAALRGWNASRTDGRVGFTIQGSMEVTRDTALLRLCAEAGVEWVFLGIETPNEAALRQANKRHNLGGDLVERIRLFGQHGSGVLGGLVVGFDADGPDIFERQLALAEAASVPFCTAGALVALPGTKLHSRLAREGRLAGEDGLGAGTLGDTNVVPAGMTRDELLDGLRWLTNELYRPEAFQRRVLGFLEDFGQAVGPLAAREPAASQAGRSIWRDIRTLLRRVARLGPAEAELCVRVARAVASSPGSGQHVSSLLLRYAQVRFMSERLGVWAGGG